MPTEQNEGGKKKKKEEAKDTQQSSLVENKTIHLLAKNTF